MIYVKILRYQINFKFLLKNRAFWQLRHHRHWRFKFDNEGYLASPSSNEEPSEGIS
jgi:hypothetical protein